MFHIYAIYCKANDKVYIGQTKTGANRFKQHRYLLSKGTHPSLHLRNAWALFGAGAFEFFVLDEWETREQANVSEQEFIAWYKAIRLSFNVMKGGEGPEHFTPEAREKIRLAHLGRPASEAQLAALDLGRDKTGFTHSEDSKAKMSAAKQGWKPSPELIEIVKKIHTGRVKSEEERRKLSEANKGSQNFLGKHHSETTKQKLSEARQGEGNPMYGKPATEERKRKVSEALKGRPGKPLTEEAKQKIREARAKQVMKPVSEETKEKIRQRALERAAKKRESAARRRKEKHGIHDIADGSTTTE